MGDGVLEQGTNKIYGAIHQPGGIIRAKNGGRLTIGNPKKAFAPFQQVEIPARPYLGLVQ